MLESATRWYHIEAGDYTADASGDVSIKGSEVHCAISTFSYIGCKGGKVRFMEGKLEVG